MTKKINFILFCVLFFLISDVPSYAYASDEILITQSNKMDDVIFDGKWSFTFEWKITTEHSLENKFDTKIRTAHQGNNIFILIDNVKDEQIDLQKDKVMICFDTKNNKSQIPDTDDYCFISVLGNSNPITLQGNNNTSSNNYFNQIPNHDDLIALGSASDENDRYNKIPHTTFEFKIPTDLVGRENIYGFYVNFFEASTNTQSSWPNNITNENFEDIPNSSQWGELISPDKSLPEFELPLLLFVSTTMGFILLNKINLLPKLY